MNRKIISAGMAMLFIFCNQAFAQIEIQKNKQSEYDSVVFDLPHNTKMILLLDDINKLKLLEKTSLDSLVKDLNHQLDVTHQTILINSDKPAVQSPLNLVMSFKKDSASIKPNKSLFLWTGLGVGMIGSHFVPQFTPTLGFRQYNREYSVSLDMMFFINRNPEKEKFVSSDSYLTIGYGFKRPNKSSYNRIAFGYLLPDNRHDSWRPSFKVSYTYSLPKTAIKLVPEFYFINLYGFDYGFAQYLPALSIRF